jgi:hypothetical protein
MVNVGALARPGPTDHPFSLQEDGAGVRRRSYELLTSAGDTGDLQITEVGMNLHSRLLEAGVQLGCVTGKWGVGPSHLHL